jgi:hypothetical protein
MNRPRIYKESILNPTSETLEPDGPQHDCPSTCVIAQQYSSLTFVSLRLISHKEHFGVRLKMLLFHFFNYLSLELRHVVSVY